jgi:hypothetical protein
LFNEPLLSTKGQRPFVGLQVSHFEEKRDAQVSVDRMGRSSVETSVLKYLAPRVVASGDRRTPRRSFDGWAVIKVKDLTAEYKGHRLSIVSAPIAGESPEENPYHAHILLQPGSTAAGDPYFLALHLRNLFEKYGEVIKPNGEEALAW